MTTAPKKRRWLPKFSLRTAIILMTVLCVWFGWYVQRAEKQKRAVEWVQENRGYVVYVFQSRERHKYQERPLTPGWLNVVDYVSNVDSVFFDKADLDSLEPLSGLKHLRYLQLWDSDLKDRESLRNLTGCKTEWMVNLSREKIEKLQRDFPEVKIESVLDYFRRPLKNR